VFPLRLLDQPANDALYFVGFDEGYRWGMIDSYVNWDGNFPPELRQGWGDGLGEGLGEWERVEPLLMRRVGLLKMIGHQRERHHRAGSHTLTAPPGG